MISALVLLLLQSQQPLFTIARSTNANVVQYDARLTASVSLDSKSPVVAYWIMLAEDGRHVRLSTIEKRMAYGFSVKADGSSGCFRMTLAADKTRPIRICAENGSGRAEMVVDGRRSRLQRMFISTRRGGLFGKEVNYIELFGTDAESGEQRYEKIVPK